MQLDINQMHYTHSYLAELVHLRDYGPNLGPDTGSKTQVQIRDQQKRVKQKIRECKPLGFLEIH